MLSAKQKKKLPTYLNIYSPFEGQKVVIKTKANVYPYIQIYIIQQ